MANFEGVNKKAIETMQKGIKDYNMFHKQGSYNQDTSRIEYKQTDVDGFLKSIDEHFNNYRKIAKTSEEDKIVEYYMTLETYLSNLPETYNNDLKEFERYALKLISIIRDLVAAEKEEFQELKIQELTKIISTHNNLIEYLDNYKEYNEQKINEIVLERIKKEDSKRNTFKNIMNDISIKKSLVDLVNFINEKWDDLKCTEAIINYFEKKYNLTQLSERICKIEDHITYKLLINNINNLKNNIFSVESEVLFNSELYVLLIMSIGTKNKIITKKALERISTLIEKDNKNYSFGESLNKYKKHKNLTVDYSQILYYFNLEERQKERGQKK